MIEAIKRRAAGKKAAEEKKGRCAVARTSHDPFGELAEAQKAPGLKQRFPDRVLVMTTDRCFERCAHCTRRWILGRTPTVETPAADLARCVEYVRRHALPHLEGGTVRERRAKHSLRRHASLQCAKNTLRQHLRLARPWRRQDQMPPCGKPYDLFLFLSQYHNTLSLPSATHNLQIVGHNL